MLALTGLCPDGAGVLGALLTGELCVEEPLATGTTGAAPGIPGIPGTTGAAPTVPGRGGPTGEGTN